MHDLTATLSHVVCQGAQRMRMLDFLPGTPFLTARALELPEPIGNSPEIEARLLKLRRLSVDAASLLPQAPQELIVALESTEPAGGLADLAARPWRRQSFV
jgi:ATP-dependent Lon protease